MIHKLASALFAAFASLALGLTGVPAVAQQSLDEIVRIEVLDGGLTARGTQQAAIKLTLADGWKTYWRSPGSAGIPPRFDWGESSNLKKVSLTWPAPEVFVLSGLQSVGYKYELVLPIEITANRPGQPIRLKGSVELGVCEDICIPARLDFDQMLSPKAGRNPAIVAALAARPYSASEAGVRAVTCRLAPSKYGGIQLTADITMPSAGGREVAIIEPGDPQLWATEATSKRRGNVLSVSSEVTHASGSSFALDRSQVRFTVLGKRRSVDIRGCTPG